MLHKNDSFSLRSVSTNLLLTEAYKPVEEYVIKIKSNRKYYLKYFGRDFMPAYDALEKFSSFINFKDKLVLEIGGAIPKKVTRNDLSVKKWISVNKYDWDQGHKKVTGCLPLDKATSKLLDSVDYQVFDGSGESIPSCFFSKFDIVCSINTFEHIQNIWNMLEKVYASLKIGGFLLASFGPIWSSHFGHHVYIDHELNFNTFKNLPDYMHLTHTNRQCYDLVKKTYGKIIADRFIVKAFFDPVINRLFAEDYIKALEASPFEYWHFTPWERKIDPVISKRLIKNCGNRLYAEGFYLIAQKQKENTEAKTSYKIGKILYFNDESICNLLSKGWSKPENWGTWSEGDEAYINIKWEEKPKNDILMNAYVKGFIDKKMQQRKIDIFVNNKKIGMWKFSLKNNLNKRSIIIPYNFLNKFDDLKIKFIINDPKSPYELKISDDRRKLGIALLWLQFENI